MARNFNSIRSKVAPGARERNRVWAKEESRRIDALNELRATHRLTQQAIGAILGVDQSRVSRLENSTDFQVSTLRRYVEATGGKLEIRAIYPDESLLIETLG